MPFNVMDGKEKNIGIIKDSFPGHLFPVYSNVFLVAITDRDINDISFDLEKIMDFVAGTYDCKSIFGKINEDKLKEKLISKFGTEIYEDTEDGYNTLLKIAFLKNLYHCDIKKFYDYDSIKDDIKGYLLLDIDKARFVGNNIMINDDMDYINYDEVYDAKPIFGRIVNHPVLYSSSECVEKWVLYGEEMTGTVNRNHAHMTRIDIASGNFNKIIEFPMPILAKKGDSIQMYLVNREVRKIFCNGIAYIY